MMHPSVLRDFDRARTPYEAARRWAAAPSSLMPAGESQNFVYRFSDAGGEAYYLRLTHPSRRTRDFVRAELDFVEYLASRGAAVAPPVRSARGELVETVETANGEIYAVVFRAVAGQPARWGSDRQNRIILAERGRTLGRIHRLAQDYEPPGPRRFHWFHDELFLCPWSFPRDEPPAVRDEFQRLLQFLLNRPRTRENYGMIHGDFGTNNTLRRPDAGAGAGGSGDGGIAVAFDFDDCCFHWFLFDIGAAMQAAIALPDDYRKTYVRVMLEGYASQKALEGDAVEDVAMFCRLSTFFGYFSFRRSIDLSAAAPAQLEELHRRRGAVERPPEWF